MIKNFILLYSVIALFNPLRASQPNVIFILTDDQGYGDLSCHGNPILRTPALDRLYSESIRLTDMHVNSFCTPTRASIMTGHYATRTGAYRTSSGRSLMHKDEVTMAEVFRDNGYATGIFGKWHLGDNYPHRPQDRGFEETLWHRCGGVGQASDYWGNDYFDDVYERNGKFELFEGYCTDVFFEGALDFIKKKGQSEDPFFVYLATNAPHTPFRVAEEYEAPYKEVAQWRNGGAAKFYGMIANIDENVARLREKLKDWSLEDNTILIFMTDNGTAGGVEMDTDALPAEGMGYNAGMRGRKASVYDGGHRVPCFFFWPEGKLTGGRDVGTLAAGYDLLPTLIDLCGLRNPNIIFDGTSLGPLLRGNSRDWKHRELVLQYQGGNGFTYLPEPYRDSAVLTQQWRLIDGNKLFDIEKDPSQSEDVSAKYPEVVERLRKRYESWWEEVSPRMSPIRVHLGNPAENPVLLTSQDWYMPVGNPPLKFDKLPKQTGPWIVEVERAGRYRISLCQWPLEAKRPILAKSARLKIGKQEKSASVKSGALSVDFEMKLSTGYANLETFFTNESGEVGGAYYTYVELLEE